MSIVVTVLSGYLVVVGAAYLMQRSLMYFPDPASPSPIASRVPEMTVEALHTADGLTLVAWYRPPAETRPAIVYFHGNGGHIGYRGSRVRPYLDAGFGMLLVEYRGYGGNPGQPSEEGLLADARAASGFLDAKGIDDCRRVLYGESLGGAIAVRLAAEMAAKERPVAAVVLEAPVSSAVDVGAHHYPALPVRWLIRDRFDARSRIADIGAPLFIAHGEQDQVVPVRFGRRLFDGALAPKEAWWVTDAGHENLPAFGIAHRVVQFLQRHVDVDCGRAAGNRAGG